MVQTWYDIADRGRRHRRPGHGARSSMRRPGQRIAILEKESTIGQHQTGHNSGVIHAGVYYAPGSLKARLCTEGRIKTYEYCEEKGIPYEKCGKLIVAIDESELPRLQNLWDRATANGVPGLRMVGPEEIREIEPHSAGIKGIFSPETGIVNWSEVARHYADDVTQAGGEILTGYEVDGHPPQGRLGAGQDDLRRDHPDALPDHLRRACSLTGSPRCPAPTRARRSCRSGATT